MPRVCAKTDFRFMQIISKRLVRSATICVRETTAVCRSYQEALLLLAIQCHDKINTLETRVNAMHQRMIKCAYKQAVTTRGKLNENNELAEMTKLSMLPLYFL